MADWAHGRDPDPLSGLSFNGLLMLAIFSSTFVVGALSALGPVLSNEFNLTALEFGYLSGVVFASAAVVSPWVGRVADALSEPAALSALFLLSGVGITAIAIAPTYPLLVIAMALCGVPMAAGNPVTNALVYRQRPQGSQGWAIGVKQAGQPVNLVLAGVLLPPLAAVTSWRIALLIAVALSATGLVWTGRTLSGLPWAARQPRDRKVDATKTARPIRILAAYSFLMGLGMSGVVAYLPLYAYGEVGLSATAAGGLTGAIGGAGLLARVLWGRAAEWSPNPAGPLTVVAAGALVSIFGIILADSNLGWLIWMGAAGFGATAHAWSGVGMMFILRVCEPQGIGKASGIVQATFFAGLTSSPLIVGALKDVTGGYAAAWWVIAGAYVAALALSAKLLRDSTLSQT